MELVSFAKPFPLHYSISNRTLEDSIHRNSLFKFAKLVSKLIKSNMPLEFLKRN